MQTTPKIQKLIDSKKGIYLEIGGGGTPQAGFINMDLRKLPTVDIVHDVEDSRGFPLPDSCVNRLLASHILEHICPKRLMFVMSEIHRVCKHEAQVFISVPYGGSMGSIMDPTHCAFFNEATFRYFDDREGLWNIYQPPILRIQAISFDIGASLEIVLVVIKNHKMDSKKDSTNSKKDIKNVKKSKR